LVRPDVAVFGRKDAQQLALVQRMVTDLELGVRIEAAALVRDADGLALSSRNRYLSPEQRAAALALPAALAAGGVAADRGGSADQVVAAARGVLAAADGVRLDYVALVDPDTFDDAKAAGEAVLAVAAKVGNTRLIDNVLVTLQGEYPAAERKG
jgi:pantoate--beta-alanine ligase